MEFLAAHGYLAVANDHLGHGKSITNPEDQGFFANDNGWEYVVQDMEKLHDITAEEYPGIPYVMFGHSMGSFLTRTYIIKHPDKYDAVILSGTGHQAKPIVLAGYTLASAAVKLHGSRGDGTKLNGVAFGAYNNGFKNPRTEYDWLSRVESEVDKYMADPLCGFVATVGLFRDMMGGIKFITNQKNINTMSKTQPVYFMSGACDPVGDNGKGVERAYKAFCDAGLYDVKMKLYPGGRHEMLNEENKYDVYNDILEWLEEKVK
jgi:alpha-beta hydrolase superfamily lysophospholipase